MMIRLLKAIATGVFFMILTLLMISLATFMAQPYP